MGKPTNGITKVPLTKGNLNKLLFFFISKKISLKEQT